MLMALYFSFLSFSPIINWINWIASNYVCEIIQSLYMQSTSSTNTYMYANTFIEIIFINDVRTGVHYELRLSERSILFNVSYPPGKWTCKKNIPSSCKLKVLFCSGLSFQRTHFAVWTFPQHMIFPMIKLFPRINIGLV